ncbi:hypothetical protein B0H14DRAFT_317442 [Mycena olivaceomarginata]|nr:hypothetical protein B0H14DRAFT_317442 [Mycena olivaceomarginata]
MPSLTSSSLPREQNPQRWWPLPYSRYPPCSRFRPHHDLTTLPWRLVEWVRYNRVYATKRRGSCCPYPSIIIHRTSGAHASPTLVDPPYDRLGTVRTAHRCPWMSIRHTPSHKAATNPGRPAALVFAVMQPHHRPHRRHPGRRAPWSKRDSPDLLSPCILTDAEMPTYHGDRSLPLNSPPPLPDNTQRPYPAVRELPSHPSMFRPAHRPRLLVTDTSPHSGIPTSQLEAVSGAHCRIADGVIAIYSSSVFAPSSIALGSMYAHRIACRTP